MTKRQMEDDAGEGSSKGVAKRSRVDIADLLGGDAAEASLSNSAAKAGPSAQAGPSSMAAVAPYDSGQNVSENESSAQNVTATILVPPTNGQASNDTESSAHRNSSPIHIEVVQDINGNLSLRGPAHAPSTGDPNAITQTTTMDLEISKYRRNVYIAFSRHEYEDETDQDILGVFSDVEKANQVVQKEFLEYCQAGNEADERGRSYGADGELGCWFQPDEEGEGTMKFWVESHRVDGRPSVDSEGRDLAAEFEQAFEGL